MAMQRCPLASPALTAMLVGLLATTPAGAIDVSDAASAVEGIWQSAELLVSKGYRAAPALMLGLAILAIMPVIAVAAPLIAHLRRPNEATRRYKGTVGDDIATDAITGEAANISSHAFVEVVGANDTRFAILYDMLRIGREDDNDIRIPSKAVHRYHAAIYREDRDDWHIADLSGSGGNGIRVNGQRCSDALLRDGDVIDLGPGRLRFRASLH